MLLEALQDVKNRPSSRSRRPASADHEVTQRDGGRASARPATPRPRGRVDSIAVLPSPTGSLDPGHEYLVYGLSEGIVDALAHVANCASSPRPPSAHYAGTDPDPQHVGRELNVEAVADRARACGGRRAAADVELSTTAGGSLLWSSRYTRAVRDVAALAETIAEEIAGAGADGAQSSARRAVKKKRAVDAEAEQLFLKGRFQWIKRHPEAVKPAMTLFQQAVERDPSFARPYAGLADCFVMLGFMHALPPREVLPKVKAAARRAIELDPSLADPHATLGYAAGLFEWDMETAQLELEEAMRLNPNYPWAPHWLGILLSGRGHTRRAIELIEMSKDLDPLSPIINVGAGIPLHIAQALRRSGELLPRGTGYGSDPRSRPLLPRPCRCRCAAMSTRRSGRSSAPSTSPARPRSSSARMAHVLGSAGRTAEGERYVEQLRTSARERYVSPYSFTTAFTGLGRIEEALDALEASLEEHNAWLWFLPIDPRFDALRAEPRFAELLERYGLPVHVEVDR